MKIIVHKRNPLNLKDLELSYLVEWSKIPVVRYRSFLECQKKRFLALICVKCVLFESHLCRLVNDVALYSTNFLGIFFFFFLLRSLALFDIFLSAGANNELSRIDY